MCACRGCSDDFADLAALQVDDDSKAVAIRFVANIGDAFQTFSRTSSCNALDQLRFVDLVRMASMTMEERSPFFETSISAFARMTVPRPVR